VGTRICWLIASAAMAFGQASSELPAPVVFPEVVVPEVVVPDYVPITASGRVHWAVSNTVGPANFSAGVITSALATKANSPPEYGPHWDGFAKRIALRTSARATSSLIEASIGSLWGEDPRYRRAPGQTVKTRLDNVLRSIVLARNREGHRMPAYARYIAIPSSTFITNAWRPDSETRLRDAVDRMTFNLISRLIGNAFAEFGPDLFKRFSKNKNTAASNAALAQCTARPQLAGCK
jgi:hypothetical protein